MKKMNSLLTLIVCFALLAQFSKAEEKTEKPGNKYVGVKMCKMCHNTEKSGKQFDIWQKSSHSEAFKILQSPEADSIVKARGIKTAASETKECLECHTITADAKECDKTFDAKDGIQCEECHGAGSAYKSMSIMKDKDKAIEAGLILYKDNAAIEKKCKTCHNDKSPTKKEFNFAESWAKIKHTAPKK